MKILKQQELEQLKLTDRQQYEASLKEYQDYYNTIATEEKVETAKEGFKAGLDVNLLAKLTKLTLEELQEIKNTMKL